MTSDGTVTIYGYSGLATSITIPSTIGGYAISGISENAFRNNMTFTKIYIPYCINTIGGYAFYGCTNLKINCEVANQPSGWSFTWKGSTSNVYWSM